MKKKTTPLIPIFLILLTFLLAGCGLTKPDIVLDYENTNEEMSEEEKEYWELVYGTDPQEESDPEKTDTTDEAGSTEAGAAGEEFNLQEIILEQTKIEFKGNYSKTSETVTCLVIAPDLGTYMEQNLESLMSLDDKALQKELSRFAQDPESPRIERKIELPVVYQNEKLIADTSSYEFQDAVSGGLQSFLNDLFVKIMEGVQ